jgi:hypothetical protein
VTQTPGTPAGRVPPAERAQPASASRFECVGGAGGAG